MAGSQVHNALEQGGRGSWGFHEKTVCKPPKTLRKVTTLDHFSSAGLLSMVLESYPFLCLFNKSF